MLAAITVVRNSAARRAVRMFVAFTLAVVGEANSWVDVMAKNMAPPNGEPSGGVSRCLSGVNRHKVRVERRVKDPIC